MYFRFKGLARRVEKMKSTRLFTELKQIDYRTFVDEWGIPQESFSRVEKTMNSLCSVESQMFLKKLFGQDVAVAVYLDDSLKIGAAATPEEVQQNLSRLTENIFVVTRIEPDLSLGDAVLKFVEPSGKDFKTTISKYKGRDVVKVNSQDGSLSISYARFGQTVVMGIGDKAARAAIDVVARKRKSLSCDEDFLKKTRDNAGVADTIGYLNFRPILSKFSIRGLNNTGYSGQIKNIQGFETLTFFQRTSDVLDGKALLYFDQSKLDPMIRNLYSTPSQENRSAKFVPWDAIFYEWGGGLDFAQMWTGFKDQLKTELKANRHPGDLDKLIGEFEQMLGLSIDKELLPALGRECGFYLTDVDTSGNVLIPQIVFFVEISSREKINLVLDKVFGLQPNLRLLEEKYQGEVIRYVPVPFNEHLNIGYVFNGSYLLFGSNLDLLKSSLDSIHDPGKSINANIALKLAGDKINSLAYCRFDRSMTKAIEMVDWAIRMSEANKSQREAFLAGGKKKFEEIKAKTEVLKNDLSGKKGELTRVDSSSILSADNGTRSEDLKKQIGVLENEIKTHEQQMAHLNQQMSSFEKRIPQDEKNKRIIDEIAKPLLRALGNIRYFSTVSQNRDGVIESTYQLKAE